MKRVSFKVAKAIKNAGYLQDHSELFYDKDGGIVYPQFMDEDDIPEKLIAIPYAMEVWLWLWREKYIKVVVSKHCDAYAVVSDDEVKLFETSDPEDAIIAAIEYIVEHNILR